METLKPPEYRRNERGQFDRPGKTLAKTAKKSGLSTKLKETNLPRGRGNPNFVKGHPGIGGRPKGSQSKITVALKDAILLAGERAGGKEGLVGYLTLLARENSSAYASLLSKVLPTTLSAPDSDGGAETHITFTRIIVHADGRREVEGATPKALPAPDALPRPTDPTDDTNEGAVR
jgi:hypothetical protein